MNRSTVWLRHGGAADQTYVLIRGWLAFIAAFDWRRDIVGRIDTRQRRKRAIRY